MDEKISGAIEVLLARVDEQMRSVIETKKMINSLRQMNGETPLFTDAELQITETGPSRSDMYYGKGLGTACREYLEWKRQACSAEDILKGLVQGGFDFKSSGWDEDNRLRNLAISLAKNSSMFHKLPNNTFGLISWYPEVVKRKGKEKPTEKATDKEEKTESTQNGDE